MPVIQWEVNCPPEKLFDIILLTEMVENSAN